MMIETRINYSSDRDLHRVGTLNVPRRLRPAALVFLGPPGAGKGTHAQHVANEYSLPHISTGDVFRTHVARETALGLQAAETMSRGLLVPDKVVCGMLREHIDSLGCSGCLVLDGFPRSVYQANWLDHFLRTCSGNNHDLLHNAPLAIQINVQHGEIMRRLSGRRSCPFCGRSYNLDFQPPINSGICDYDDNKLVMRPDDSESVIRERLMVHDENASPLAESYRCKGRLLEIDGNATVDAVRNAITTELESYFAFWR